MRVVLDLDDFSILDTCEMELRVLNEYFPKFKVNMFSITGGVSAPLLREFKEYGCVFYPHGFNHVFLEMDSMDYEKVRKNLLSVDKYVNEGLFGKVFKAPYWRYSNDSYRALAENGFVVAISREQGNPPSEDVRTYEYDYELHEAWPPDFDGVLRLHGHCTPYINGLSTCYTNLIDSLPKDTEFISIEEFLGE
jgi:peptidoglycan/xylan/chitin deacetylase (PgdA/CDA1 family)